MSFNQKIEDNGVSLHGGSGGIGSTAIQIGAAWAKVFATELNDPALIAKTLERNDRLITMKKILYRSFVKLVVQISFSILLVVIMLLAI